MDEEIKWSEEYKEGEPGQSKLRTFKAKIQKELMVERFTTTLDLELKVATDVGRYLVKHNDKSLVRIYLSDLGLSSVPSWILDISHLQEG